MSSKQDKLQLSAWCLMHNATTTSNARPRQYNLYFTLQILMKIWSLRTIKSLSCSKTEWSELCSPPITIPKQRSDLCCPREMIIYFHLSSSSPLINTQLHLGSRTTMCHAHHRKLNKRGCTLSLDTTNGDLGPMPRWRKTVPAPPSHTLINPVCGIQ